MSRIDAVSYTVNTYPCRSQAVLSYSFITEKFSASPPKTGQVKENDDVAHHGKEVCSSNWESQVQCIVFLPLACHQSEDRNLNWERLYGERDITGVAWRHCQGAGLD